ncbi:uncharacterized protein LOC124931529 [Impatiens glandulifera]|uniref:uncharacterized protein LOC124931529 n=1 Tax=Impatiens glandulifera TaxID=253017 RepID=UPI001FB0E085|nr:uncharacterized protein LOC124931529 [Impatiens glandulifera]
MASPFSCPANSFIYNSTLCACNPGYFIAAGNNNKTCELFASDSQSLVVNSGVDYSINFPETIFSFDSIKKFTQSQAVFLEATAVLLVSWLCFCLFVRFRKLDDGRSIWFRIRWWISRLDISFSTRHWLDDQKIVVKRKTELGGAFSIASWIVFLGLFAALLYQIISKRAIEVHTIRASNAPDLAAFQNDIEFNIITISSMSCAHLRQLGILVIGNPGYIDYRTAPLVTFANYTCQNTTKGPKINLKCSKCHIRDSAYISWQFVDLPNDPAMAVGFEFNLTANSHGVKKHVSLVGGTLSNGSNDDNMPTTFRGSVPNIFKFNLFPRIYHNLHNLKLIQPLFHEFVPGTSYSEMSQLQASLQVSSEGLINTTLYVNYLSDYIVEIDNQNILGPVSFLADLGGLYCISIGIFFYFLVQCEYRIKRLRNEDSTMRNIRSHRRAQDNWDKLRKYVMFTWGCNALEEKYNNVQEGPCCTGLMVGALHKRTGSSVKRGQLIRMDSIRFNKKINMKSEKETASTQSAQTLSKIEMLDLENNMVGNVKDDKRRQHHPSREIDSNSHYRGTNNYSLPPPPILDMKDGSEISMSEIHKNFQNLYEYNVKLRDELAAAHTMISDFTSKATSSTT